MRPYAILALISLAGCEGMGASKEQVHSVQVDIECEQDAQIEVKLNQDVRDSEKKVKVTKTP